ncbi:hypothetical protein H0H93_011048 [Arthromyces matolae]|nr:hypothetical protein H0H93_011048 [Arthromyces matolae]
MPLCGWQDSIAPEILDLIFNHAWDTHSTTEDSLPFNVSGFPWTLGRVCNKWRQVSRSNPKFWRTRITVTAILPVSYHKRHPAVRLISESLRALQCAADLLPEGRHIVLEVADSINLQDTNDQAQHSVPPTALLEFLPLVSHLKWKVFFDAALFPPGSLAELERLSIISSGLSTVYGGTTLSLDHFGKSPRLQTLEAIGPTPHYITSGIPWSFLRSLTLIPRTFVLAPEVKTAWETFFSSKAITDLSSLQELTLICSWKLVEIFFAADFPWPQLTSYQLRVHGGVSFKSLLLNMCRLSTALGKIN